MIPPRTSRIQMFESTKSTQMRLTRQTFPTKTSEGLKRRGEQVLEVRKALEIPMEDVETIRERELARRSVLEAGPAAANSASRGREFSAWVSREQNASNNLDTKALGRE